MNAGGMLLMSVLTLNCGISVGLQGFLIAAGNPTGSWTKLIIAALVGLLWPLLYLHVCKKESAA